MPLSVYEQFKQLTPQEKQYILAHPNHAPAIKSSKEKAFMETTKHFGRNGRNDKSDAFRHCYWSALLARDIGHSGAFHFTTAHESSTLNSRDERNMDLHNNKVGLAIGASGGSDEHLSHLCMAALSGGRLKILAE